MKNSMLKKLSLLGLSIMLTGSVFAAGLNDDDSDEKSRPTYATFKVEAKKYLQALITLEECNLHLQSALDSLVDMLVVGMSDYFNSDCSFLVTIAPYFDNDDVDDVGTIKTNITNAGTDTQYWQRNFGDSTPSSSIRLSLLKLRRDMPAFRFRQIGRTQTADPMYCDAEEVSYQPNFGIGTAGQLSSSVVTTSKPGDCVGISRSEQGNVDQLKQIHAMKLREENSDDESDDDDTANTNADV